MKLTEIFEKIDTQKKDMEFMPTGFLKIDEFLDGGFMRKELIILGGGTGSGKSYIAGNILFNVTQKGFNTAYFSLEISNEMVVSRLIGSLSNIKPTRIMAGLLTKEENEKRIQAKAKLSPWNNIMNFYDDVYEFEKIKKKLDKEILKYPLSIRIVVEMLEELINLYKN